MNSETKADDQIVTECDLKDHPGKVWQALTEPELTALWLVPKNVDCQIIAAEPPRFLRCAWRSDESDGLGNMLDTVVTFELSPTDEGGTHLRIVHEGFATARAAGVLGFQFEAPQCSVFLFCGSNYPKSRMAGFHLARSFSVRCDNDNSATTMMRAA